MSCVREASLEPPAPYSAARLHARPHDHDERDPHRHGEGRKGRFLRGLRRMFRRRSGARAAPPDRSPEPDKSRSTSELLAADLRQRRKEGAYSSGLSVSHDSVFTGDRSGDDSSDERPTPPHLALSSGHRAELVAAVRRRGRGADGSDDDEDLGLPRSPPASPPTDKADKRHHGISASSCSDGSLLSVGSSEMDEDSSAHDSSGRHPPDYRGEPPTGVAPLSHSAAKHKMAVRPRRTHGAPRRKKNIPIAAQALPITPELNEEMMRSATPDVAHKSSEVVTESFSSSTTTKKISVKEAQSQFTKDLNRVLESTPGDVKLKSSSLPPGLALSQLVGQSPAKLSLADPQDSPRSSIKRSKSSSQGKFLRDDSPQSALASVSEQHNHACRTEERISRHKKHEEEEKKSKSEKKSENEYTRTSTKKEESFFSRLLLRKSGKKVKKEADELHDSKKVKLPDKIVSQQYRSVDREYTSSMAYSEYQHRSHSTERSAHKSAGQRAFANQVHRRLDNKGTYVNDNVFKELHNVSKKSVIDYGANDLKIAEETDKMLNMDINLKYAYNKNDDKSKRHTTKESNYRHDAFTLHGPEMIKRPPLSVQRLIDPYTSSKAFISNEVANLSRENSHLSPTLVEELTDGPLLNPRQRPGHNDFVFHSGSMPKNIPYFNQNLKLSASASPPRSVLHQSSENVKHLNRSTDFSSVSFVSKDREELILPRFSRNEPSETPFFPAVIQQEVEKDLVSGLKSLGEEFVEQRSSIGKSHSFRHHSEANSISSQENQMPSLPAIVGISEPLMESWEVNYRRTVSHDSARFNDRSDDNKRLSARNYNVLNPSDNYDSLPSTDSSYLDSLKGEPNQEDRKSMFLNIHNESRKRDSDISQIEAKIDTIIGSPKPFISSVLKSSSLDSVKSLTDRPTTMEERRKTISVESALSHGAKNPLGERDATDIRKYEQDGFVSITHLNKDPNSNHIKSCELPKVTKSDEKLQINSKPGLPEFLKIQLNKVDSKPATNVVLTANVTPKKPEPVLVETAPAETTIEIDKDSNESPLQIYLRKTGSQQLLNRSLEFLGEDSPPQKVCDKPMVPNRNSPLNARKTLPPQSPTTPKMFIKRKATSIDLPEVKQEKSRNNSLSTDNSNERIYENISMDQKSYSSFGSKTSLQSSDSNEAKTPERQEDGVVYRRKPIMIPKEHRNGSKHDDEPELMKVFARRSLKLKDSEAETLAQEIAEGKSAKGELVDNVFASKTKKNEFNSSIKSRDSDKENEDQINHDGNTDQKNNDTDANKRNNDRIPNIQNRTTPFSGSQYQRSISVTSVSSIPGNPKRDSAPAQMKSEVNRYKKEVSDSTPEKRLRNRTFPDPSNDREDIKIATKTEAYKVDTIPKRPLWMHHKKEDESKKTIRKDDKMNNEREETVEETKEWKQREEKELEKECENEETGEADGSPQFKGILQMRAEWERRAKQGMTK